MGTTLSTTKDIISENPQDCFGGRNLKGSIHLISKVSVKNDGNQKNVQDIFVWLQKGSTNLVYSKPALSTSYNPKL